MRTSTAALLSLLLATAAAPAPAAQAAPSKAPDVLANTEAHSGLLPVHVDKKAGRILLSLPAPDREGLSGRYIYVTSLKTGLGSAPIGLDRALTSGSKLQDFRRGGKNMVAEVENPRFRATNAPAPEQAAARESFAYSTIWMGDIASETTDGRLLVDVSSLLTMDMLGIGQALKGGGEKGFALVGDLSVADPNAVKVLPDNI